MAGVRHVLFLAVVLGGAAPSAAADRPADGTYKLSYALSPAIEATNWLIHLETRDGKTTGSVAAANPRLKDTRIDKVTVAGDRVRVVVKGPSGEQTFEGQVAPDDARTIVGSFGNDRRLYLAWMTLTDLTEIHPRELIRRTEIPEPMQQAGTLAGRANVLRAQARRAKDANEKASLLKQAEEAEKEAAAELPKLYREVVEKHADSSVVFEAAGSLLGSAATHKADTAQVAAWAKLLTGTTAPYGRRWQEAMTLRVAEALAVQDGYGQLALDYARQAEKLLTADATPARRLRTLKPLVLSLRRTGQADQAHAVQGRVDALEAVLDQEYLAGELPFRAEAFAGRKGKSDRPVIMELFTGAQCPPCVAAGVAFDALLKAYKPADLILLQYHLHIPGPDPLTNAASEARFEYYQEEFPDDVRGTPSTVFNGKPQAGGGGGLDEAREKFHEYRGIIDPLLEKDAGARIAARASQQGNQVQIQVDVAGLSEPGPGKKLRLVLVEESVRYLGVNNLRFHHHVVRAFPGGVEGFALKEKNSKHTVRMDLDELRKQQARYWDESHARHAFPHLDRPLDLKDLRVIAFVQDDKTKEILQGAQVEIVRNRPE